MAVRSAVSLGEASILTKLEKDCATPLPVLRRVANAMAADVRSGLAVDGGSDLKMILSYVDTLPTGNEKGMFYALDLGGTNFRVLRVQLGGKEERVVSTEFEQLSIPQELMFGTSEELFNFIASALAKFAQEGEKCHMPPGRTREIGFTFSFPVRQTSVKSGILINWTKGFAVSGTVGKDVVACLNEAMERLGLDMQVSALVNDTVATLAGARYWDDDVLVAIILGTRTNACYVERTNAIPKLSDHHHSSSGLMVVNTEWGAFSSGLPLTEFDREMDADSINPGEQIFEKTISGMYLGEIVRRVLVKMSKSSGLFGDSVAEKLFTPFVLGTPDICAMQQDTSRDLESVGSILYKLTGVKSDPSARKIVVGICDAIARRGGRLAGAGIVGILQKMEEDEKGSVFGRKRAVVAMDGGLYENYPQYRDYLQEAVTELLGEEMSKNVVIEHSKDGSGIGAALLAAANSKYVRTPRFQS
ncbi:unnamed protein product [Cuscuta campestris]|uniref:Phosphotransferase n=1 Tax=Cuscuta campestris TaxID=132261 RepID=A0A484M1N6_9ASTE|nr:unnamed protein product [Cuscuta campestris]